MTHESARTARTNSFAIGNRFICPQLIHLRDKSAERTAIDVR